MLEGFDKMLKVIQRYFTCEGRFNMVYQYTYKVVATLHRERSYEPPFLPV
jgi:hypothetical protein